MRFIAGAWTDLSGVVEVTRKTSARPLPPLGLMESVVAASVPSRETVIRPLSLKTVAVPRPLREMVRTEPSASVTTGAGAAWGIFFAENVATGTRTLSETVAGLETWPSAS